MSFDFSNVGQFDISLEDFRYAARRWLNIMDVTLPKRGIQDADIWKELLDRILTYEKLEKDFYGWVRVVAHFVMEWAERPSRFVVQEQWLRLKSEVAEIQREALESRLLTSQQQAPAWG